MVLDQTGPIDFAPGHGIHVGAHPHTGLQTFTWLIEGEVLHRDSLGNEQLIRPGAVNLMTAGRGIVHTEDSTEGQRPHLAQLWIALPPEAQECPAGFAPYTDLPRLLEDDAHLTLLAGTYGERSAPARVYSPLVGLDIRCDTATTVDPEFEYGLLPLSGDVTLDEECFQADEFAYLGRGRNSLRLNLAAGAKVLLLGGRPFEQPVLMWWNFVGFTKAAIAEAQRQWENGDPRFAPVVDGSAPPLPWRDY